MKFKIIISILVILVISGMVLLKDDKGVNNMAEANVNHKILVAYFSRTGEQYGVGNITEGNTAIVAKMIAKKTNGDLFEIKVKNDNYPNTYNALVEYAKKEKQQKVRPELIGKVENFDSYDTVFIGYPNWWADMPMPVYTFLESYNFEGKNVYHFCTHEGSGGVKEGLHMYGHTAQNEKDKAQKLVSDWLNKIGY